MSITDEQIAEIEAFAHRREDNGFETLVLSADELFQIIKRLREAEKDAARYKFLRNSGKFSPSAFGDGWSLNCGYTRAQPTMLDAAIDTAMQGNQ